MSASATDIHRLIDNRLPAEKVCTGVIKTAVEGGAETYTATINGEEIAAEADPQSPPEEIADCIVAQIATAKNAKVEGDDPPRAEPAADAAPVEYEYDDSEDDDEDEPASKSKAKSKSHSKK